MKWPNGTGSIVNIQSARLDIVRKAQATISSWKLQGKQAEVGCKVKLVELWERLSLDRWRGDCASRGFPHYLGTPVVLLSTGIRQGLVGCDGR